MGSLEGYAKGTQPMLDRVRAHNAAYNDAVIATRRRAPLWRRALALLPNPKGPLHRWEAQQWGGKREKQHQREREFIAASFGD